MTDTLPTRKKKMLKNTIPNRYILKDCYKGYTESQDKVIPPKMTFNKAFYSLKKAFPNIEMNLIEQINKPGFYAYDFKAGGLNTHGKGATLDQAKASAIMEFTERYTWLNFDYKKAPGYIFTSFNELKKNYDLSDIEKLLHVPFTKDPIKFKEEIKKIPSHWIECFCITTNTFNYYPISFFNNFASSNGLASGNSLEEAIFQGLCECIERHNIDYWMANMKSETQEIIDNETIQNKLLKNLINLLKKDDVDIYLFQTSKPCEIPTFAACGIDSTPVKKVVETGYGYGTHTDPEKAMIRAVTEYIQARAGFLKDDRVPEYFHMKKGQWQFSLQMDIKPIIKKSSYIASNTIKSFADNNIKIEIKNIINNLKSLGCNAYFINKTQKDLKIPVVRTFVTGFTQGSSITSINASEQYLYGNLLYQAEMPDKAEEYYRKNFKKFAKDLAPVEDLLPLILKKEHIEKVKDIDITQVLTPENMPFHNMFQKNFQDIYDSRNLKAPKELLDLGSDYFKELS